MALSLASGPVIALAVIVAMGLMLAGPRAVERIAEVVGLRHLFVLLWDWLHYPVALVLLWMALSVVYRYGSAVRQRFGSVVLGAASERIGVKPSGDAFHSIVFDERNNVLVLPQ